MSKTVKFRKKPVEVEAVQWTGENREEVELFLGRPIEVDEFDEFLWAGDMHERLTWFVKDEGRRCAKSPAAFAATYEPVEGESGEGLADTVWQCLSAVSSAVDRIEDDDARDALQRLERALKDVTVLCPIEIPALTSSEATNG